MIGVIHDACSNRANRLTDRPKTDDETRQAGFPVPVVDTPHAPVLFIEGSLNFGVRNGVVNMTLGTERAIAQGGTIHNDSLVAAHLRMGIPAAQVLRTSLDNALLLAMEASGEGKAN
jgi:hypothetical protein